MTTHTFNPEILHACDIRGIVGKNLFLNDAYELGKRFTAFLPTPLDSSKVAVVWDGRESSPLLAQNLIQGLTDAGHNALSLGEGPTPLLYFAVQQPDIIGGIMITASHNPPEYNGFKLVTSNGPFFGKQIEDLASASLVPSSSLQRGHVIKDEKVLADYLDLLVQTYPCAAIYKVIWDAGNGICGPLLTLLTKRLPGEHILLNCVPDPSFPNHHPDPCLPENMAQLQNLMQEEQADVGIAFDGDGDRMGAVDAQGRIWFGEDLTDLFARDICTRSPGQLIIVDTKTTDATVAAIEELGGIALRCKTGHAYMKEMIKEKKAAFGGEYSGHLYFADTFFGYDDALYSAMRLFKLLFEKKAPLAFLFPSREGFYTEREACFYCRDHVQTAACYQAIVQYLKDTSALNVDLNDGVRLNYSDGWILIRCSNSEPKLTSRVEGYTPAGLIRLKKLLTSYISICI